MSEWGRGVGGARLGGVTEGKWGEPCQAPLTGAGFSGRRKGLGTGWIHSGCGFPRKQGARSWAGDQDRSPRRKEGTRPGEGRAAPRRDPRDPPEGSWSECGQTGQRGQAPAPTDQGPGQEVGGLLAGGLVGEGMTARTGWGLQEGKRPVGRWEGTADSGTLRTPRLLRLDWAGGGRPGAGRVWSERSVHAETPGEGRRGARERWGSAPLPGQLFGNLKPHWTGRGVRVGSKVREGSAETRLERTRT